jgi:hypothetical protein
MSANALVVAEPAEIILSALAALPCLIPGMTMRSMALRARRQNDPPGAGA